MLSLLLRGKKNEKKNTKNLQTQSQAQSAEAHIYIILSLKLFHLKLRGVRTEELGTKKLLVKEMM